VNTLTKQAIRSRYDSASFQRGERYQREGRVQDLQTHTTPIGLAVTGMGLGDSYPISFREIG
jgi:uncharacterized Zn finger protein